MLQRPLPEIDFATDALLFDVDGTLLDIAARPEDVIVPESLRENLAELDRLCDGAVALLSGRTLAIIDGLFLPLKLTTIGSHGAEFQLRPGGPVEHCAPRLAENVRQAFADRSELDPRIVVEDKGYTLAFHYRAAPDQADALIKFVSERLQPFEPQFIMLCGKAVVEVKSASFNKGGALRRLLSKSPFKGRRPIYFGDDTTDEDAFRALSEFGGIGVSVGRDMIGAAYEVSAPRAVRDWLAHIARHGGGSA